jgi:hypothetical protein
MECLKRSLMLVVAAVTCFALPSAGHASTVVTWNGSDSFNGTTAPSGSDFITFTGFTANQLTGISGDGTYEAAGSGTTSTTFNLWLDLNGTWTSIESWVTSDNHEQDLSGISLPKNFASATITGIALTANPSGTGDDPSFDNFRGEESGHEQFTFNTVATTPIPGAFALFGSVLFGGIGVSTWRKRRGGRSAISILA